MVEDDRVVGPEFGGACQREQRGGVVVELQAGHAEQAPYLALQRVAAQGMARGDLQATPVGCVQGRLDVHWEVFIAAVRTADTAAMMVFLRQCVEFVEQADLAVRCRIATERFIFGRLVCAGGFDGRCQGLLRLQQQGVRLRMIEAGPYRDFQYFDDFLFAVEAPQALGDTDPVLSGLGLRGAGTGQVIERRFGMATLHLKNTEIVVGFRVIGQGLQDSAVELLGIIQQAGPVMLDSSIQSQRYGLRQDRINGVRWRGRHGE